MDKGMWIAFDSGGLSNRIKGFVSALRVDPHARILWTHNAKQCDCSFTDLFVDASRDVRPGSGSVQGAQVKWSWRFEVHPNDPVPPDFSAIREFYGTCTGYRDIDFEYVRIPLAMRDIFLSILHTSPCLAIQPVFEHERQRFYDDHRIVPVDVHTTPQCVNDDVGSFMIDSNASPEHIRRCIQPTCQGGVTVAVHVRSWNDDPHRHQTYFDFATYTRVMDAFQALCPDVRFVVAADDAKYVDTLRTRYGADVILTVPHPFAKDTMNAFLEMLTLARLPVLIGTYISTFTELIWWFGNCRARPFIVRRA